MDIPVYLIAGFLDAGKTSFINGILQDGFAAEDRTLLLCCEEGETAYDPKVLGNVFTYTIDEPEQMTPEMSPFDLSGGKLEVPDDDYGIWYVDMMDNPDRYEGVEVSFKAIMCHSKKFRGVHCPGRFAMVCCDKDMQFLALVCRGEGLENFKDKEWVKIHATVRKEKCDAYQGEGPVLYVSSIAATTKPANEMVSF